MDLTERRQKIEEYEQRKNIITNALVTMPSSVEREELEDEWRQLNKQIYYQSCMIRLRLFEMVLDASSRSYK